MHNLEITTHVLTATKLYQIKQAMFHRYITTYLCLFSSKFEPQLYEIYIHFHFLNFVLSLDLMFTLFLILLVGYLNLNY